MMKVKFSCVISHSMHLSGILTHNVLSCPFELSFHSWLVIVMYNYCSTLIFALLYGRTCSPLHGGNSIGVHSVLHNVKFYLCPIWYSEPFCPRGTTSTSLLPSSHLSPPPTHTPTPKLASLLVRWLDCCGHVNECQGKQLQQCC